MSVWRLNDEKLLVTDVQTFPTPPMSVSRQRRLKRDQTQNTGREGGENLRSLGWDLPRINIVFKLVGRGQPKTDELEFILNEIEDNEVITLEAPDTLPIHVYLDEKRSPLTVESWNNDPSNSQAEQKLRLQASVLGTWIEDGGEFYETIFGHFKKTDNSPTYEREDGTEQSDLTITVDAQTTGYLKAKNPNTLQWDTLTPSSTSQRTKRDGTAVPTETYDLSGYLFPSDPSSVGDVGLFEIRQSPSFAELEVASATITGASSLNAAALIPTNMAATIASQSSVNAALLLIQAASSTIQNASAVNASAVVIEATPVSSTIQNASAVNASAIRIVHASATIQSDSAVNASARNTTVRASATLSNASAVNASARNITVRASATIASASSVTASPAITVRTMSATLASASSVTGSLEQFTPVSSTVQSQSTVTASAIRIVHASATLTSTSSVTASTDLITSMTVDAFETGDLTAYSGDTA